MTDQDLLFFLGRIREMCGTDWRRMTSALQTLQGILERQGGQAERVKTIRVLQDSYAATRLSSLNTDLHTMDDVAAVITDARRAREYDNAHRGCR